MFLSLFQRALAARRATRATALLSAMPVQASATVLAKKNGAPPGHALR